MVQHDSTITVDTERKARGATDGTSVDPLPADYRAALGAFVTYLDQRPSITPPDATSKALDDLADLFAEAAARGIPIRDVVGHDPVAVAEALFDNHTSVAHDAGVRAELARAIDAIVADR